MEHLSINVPELTMVKESTSQVVNTGNGRNHFPARVYSRRTSGDVSLSTISEQTCSSSYQSTEEEEEEEGGGGEEKEEKKNRGCLWRQLGAVVIINMVTFLQVRTEQN